MKAKPEKLIPDMPRETLAQFVMDFCDNRVFTSAHFNKNESPDVIGMVFMPIALGALAKFPKKEIKNIGLIYEYYDKAGPMGINGYPMFFSCKFMNMSDWQEVSKEIQKEIFRREESKKVISGAKHE